MGDRRKASHGSLRSVTVAPPWGLFGTVPFRNLIDYLERDYSLDGAELVSIEPLLAGSATD